MNRRVQNTIENIFIGLLVLLMSAFIGAGIFIFFYTALTLP